MNEQIKNVYQKINQGLKNGVKLINIYSPMSVDISPLVLFIQAQIPNIQNYQSSQNYISGSIVIFQKFRQSKQLNQLQQNIQYILFSSFPLYIATIRLSYSYGQTNHPIVYLTNQKIQNQLNLMHPKFKEAILSIHRKENLESQYVDEINILRLKGIIVGKLKINLSLAELNEILSQ
ncbi:hypothetical protein SS50377_25511 [Spironucleus salmonicida]|uniref:Uncharacterized protein n=1 Tax=Spironucleus salmonicida TaxID=348837 RepID=A0A9P8LSI8_9EUKA|nr:hypothetical protein SS50377_25511 [Spironucleus salmonicida]